MTTLRIEPGRYQDGNILTAFYLDGHLVQAEWLVERLVVALEAVLTPRDEVPDGLRREVEWAVDCGTRESGWTSEPFYRRDAAERECEKRDRDNCRVVYREILAGPWTPWDDERPKLEVVE